MTVQRHDASDDRPDPADRVRSPSADSIGRWERLATAVLGGVLLARGVRKRSLGGAVTALVGGGLLYRAGRGHSRLSQRLDSSTPARSDRGEDQMRSPTPTVEQTITVGKPADELSRFWSDPEQLTRILGRVGDVSSSGEESLRWRVRGPLGRIFSWETRVVEDGPKSVRWESLEGATVPAEGSVSFRPAPGDRGTVVTLSVNVDPPGGVLATAATERLELVSRTLVWKVLRRFKSLAETGEIPTLEHNPSARGSGDLL